MGVHDIYGLSGPTGSKSEPDTEVTPPREAGEDTASAEPTTEPDKPNAKLSATSAASAAVDQLLNSHRPISSAIHSSATEPDSAAKPKRARAAKKGVLSRIAGAGATSPATKPDAVATGGGDATDKPENDTASTSDDDAPNSKKSAPLLRARHWVIGGAGLAIALVCALIAGFLTTAEPDDAAPATNSDDSSQNSTAPEVAGQQRDKPLPLSIDPPVCWSPSNNVENAISTDEDKAFTCTPAWNADGTLIVIHLTGGPYRIAKVRMIPGWDYTGKDNVDQWFKYRTVTIATWRFDDGKPYEQTFDGSRDQQSKDIPDEIYATTVTLQITKTTVPAGGTTPETTSTSPTPGLPGLPGGWGTINLPGTGGQPSAGGQASTEPKAFALSALQILGHKPR